jgi:hypothetical protein
MIKMDQPFEMILSIASTTSLSGASSCYMSYISPDGSTGIYSTTILDASTSPTITYSFSSGVLNKEGEWRFTPYIKLSDGLTYPCNTYEINVVNEFSS